MEKINWTLNTRLIFFLSILLFLTGYLFSNFFSALAGLLVLAFLYFCKLHFKNSIGEIHIERNILENLLYVDHPFHVKTSILHNGGNIFIKATDVIPDSSLVLHGSNSKLEQVDFGEELVLSYQLKFNNRGNHEFSTVHFDISDICNFFTIHLSKTVITKVNVHSNPAELKKAKTGYTKEDTLAIPSLVGSEITREFEGIRKYLPGDLIKDIDWKASSRLQTLLTKTFQKKEMLETMILLDCTRSMRRSRGTHSKLEHAMVVGIQLTHMLQSIHHKVGLIAYDEHKMISQIEPSFDYRQIYNELSKLPNTIKTDSYKPDEFTDLSESSNTFCIEDSVDQQQFLSSITPFITGRNQKIKHPLQTTGIYQAISSFIKESKQKHLVIITDLESNLDSFYFSLNIAHAKQFNIWLLSLFTPYYHVEGDNFSSEILEKTYRFQISRENIIKKLQKKNIEIIEITPKIQVPHIMETLRRKK